MKLIYIIADAFDKFCKKNGYTGDQAGLKHAREGVKEEE